MKRTCHRRYIEEEELNEELRKYLPREDGKAVEKPAEAALRTKMCASCRISMRHLVHCSPYSVRLNGACKGA